MQLCRIIRYLDIPVSDYLARCTLSDLIRGFTVSDMKWVLECIRDVFNRRKSGKNE